jgi:hypothetical protein
VWRLRQSSSREVLRLGRVAAERWQEVPGGLACVASQPLVFDAAGRFEQLPGAIEALFGRTGNARVTVVLESAWVPLMLAETGRSVWRRPEVEALLRHRLALLHDDPADPVAEWDVRVDHSVGNAQALAYGFSSSLREALAEAARLVGREWAALLPAWAWGWQRSRPQRQWSGRVGHWALNEQDRMLLGSFEAGRLVALNAAARVCDDSQSLAQGLAAHVVRSGLPASEWPVVATAWCAAPQLPASAERVMWQGLGAQGAAASLVKVAA